MSAKHTISVDQDLCNGCGLCVAVCPSETLKMGDGRAVVTDKASMGCGHCEAACPTQAVRCHDIDRGALAFQTITVNDQWIPHGRYDTAELVRLMASRRSCRNFTQQPVPREVLTDLVKIGTTAPSGTNSQQWAFTILPDRAGVLELGERMAAFFSRLNRLSEKAYLRRPLRWIGKAELDDYYRDHYLSVKEALGQWERTGRDLLFHGAPNVIVVGSAPGASCPSEDALLATQNILLAAHGMGLGTCLVGFAVSAMQKDPTIQTSLGIPPAESIHAVIALGYPDEKYRRCAGRKPSLVRFAG